MLNKIITNTLGTIFVSAWFFGFAIVIIEFLTVGGAS